MTNKLFDKVYGALIGSAVGDAMGAPVEMLKYEQIEARYGRIQDMLPYDAGRINPHGPWDIRAGTYTDDSRMSKIFCEAMIDKGSSLSRADLKKVFSDYYYASSTPLQKQFIEEYYYKAIYDDDKLIFGGQPANGAVMGIVPFGIVNLCRPSRAHNHAFDCLFITEGYARYSASIAAAAIAAAFSPRATDIDWCIYSALDSVQKHREGVEGETWKEWEQYENVSRKNEQLIEKALDIVHTTPYDKLYLVLEREIGQQFFADGAETLAIALAFCSYAKGNYVKAITECVNFGRDCDSSASVAGALCGAYSGISAIPTAWVKRVEAVNPAPSFHSLASALCDMIEREYQALRIELQDIDYYF